MTVALIAEDLVTLSPERYAGRVSLGVYYQGGSREKSRRLLEGLSKDKGRSEALTSFVNAYLARSHRDAPGKGCAIAAVGADVARQPKAVRDCFTEALEGTLETLADLFPGKTAPHRRDRAIALFSEMLGALILARAVSDESLSRRILKTAANRLPATTR